MAESIISKYYIENNNNYCKRKSPTNGDKVIVDYQCGCGKGNQL